MYNIMWSNNETDCTFLFYLSIKETFDYTSKSIGHFLHLTKVRA